MDYLDLKKQRRHTVMLYVGYALVGLAITIAATILLYQAYGFGVDKKGEVIQNGLTFFSSKPNPADITLNGKLNSKKTNTRLVLPANVYNVKLSRNGYVDWQRKITLSGGEVKHFDYPFLFPKELTTTQTQKYTSLPPLMTQSQDKRWLLLQPSPSLYELSLFDLDTPAKDPVPVTIPANILTKATSSESWQLGEWSDDDRHILMQHIYDGKKEFIVIDVKAPEESVNLNVKFNINPLDVALRDKKYDKYYILDTSANLQTAVLSQEALNPKLKGVISFKSYGDDTVIYATNVGAIEGKTKIKLVSGQKNYDLRTVTAGSNYTYDLAKYSGAFYVAFGSSLDDRAYIYKDPVGQIESEPNLPPATTRVFSIKQVGYIRFSNTAQLLLVQGGNKYGIYDFENKESYVYETTKIMDNPQTHANWMDGHRLFYISEGKMFVFDYDNINQRVLMPAVSTQLPAFDPEYKNVFSLAPSVTAGQIELTQTSLLIESDQ